MTYWSQRDNKSKYTDDNVLFRVMFNSFQVITRLPNNWRNSVPNAKAKIVKIEQLTL